MKILNDFVQKNFKVVLYNHYYEGLEYMVHLSEDKSLFVALDVPDAYLGSFSFRGGGSKQYLLRVIEEPINGKVSFCQYEFDDGSVPRVDDKE